MKSAGGGGESGIADLAGVSKLDFDLEVLMMAVCHIRKRVASSNLVLLATRGGLPNFQTSLPILRCNLGESRRLVFVCLKEIKRRRNDHEALSSQQAGGITVQGSAKAEDRRLRRFRIVQLITKA